MSGGYDRLRDTIARLMGSRRPVNFQDVGDTRRLKFDRSILLGTGSNGTRVYLGTFRQHITNEQQEVAIKQILFNTADEYRRALHEVANLQRLTHPNLVTYFFADKIDAYDIMCIALELCLGSLVDMFVHKRDVFKKPFILRNRESILSL
jgi:serine/threonine protein kinase